MVDTAKILNSSNKVLFPDLDAECSFADADPADSFEKFVDAQPYPVVPRMKSARLKKKYGIIMFVYLLK